MKGDMTDAEIRTRRLANLGLLRVLREAPERIVASLGAMQAQDHRPAKWAIARRNPRLDDRAVQHAYAEGEILRTHVLRPTWHFVARRDIRWLLGLTGPRVKAANASAYRQLDLDTRMLDRCVKVLLGALQRGDHLTRSELGDALLRRGIPTDARRLAYIMMHAELDAIVCSGVPRGRTHTYALVDHRAPDALTLGRDEALTELARRYFTTHGPATIKDFGWWASLTSADIRHAVEHLDAELVRTERGGEVLYGPRSSKPRRRKEPSILLLQAYDEYLVAYRETKYIVDPDRIWAMRDGSSFLACIVLDGKIVGRWKPVQKSSHVAVEVALHRRLSAAQARALEKEVAAYGNFAGAPAVLTHGV